MKENLQHGQRTEAVDQMNEWSNCEKQDLSDELDDQIEVTDAESVVTGDVGKTDIVRTFTSES